MSDQFHIYKYHADKYHALVSSEDREHNLNALLLKHIDFTNKNVIEAGLGTGRLTEMYLHSAAKIWGFDQSQHMLDFASQFLGSPSHLELSQEPHEAILDLPIQADIFIEGWAFGHWFLSLYPDYEGVLNDYFNRLYSFLNPTATIILIETLGTFREQAFQNTDLNIFYDFLEKQHQFQRFEIRTDYQFESLEKATDIMTFFFGESLGQQVKSEGSTRIPEVTGVWIKRTGTSAKTLEE